MAISLDYRIGNCAKTGKQRYGSRLDAKKALLHYRLTGGRSRRFYRCSQCADGWHLTSKAVDERAVADDVRDSAIVCRLADELLSQRKEAA